MLYDYVQIRKDRDTDKSRGFGFVTFETEEAAEKAIRELHGVKMEGRPLTVKAASVRGSNSNNTSGEDTSWQTAPPPRRGKRNGKRKSRKGKSTAKSWSTWAVPTEDIVADDDKIVLNGKVVTELYDGVYYLFFLHIERKI